MTEEFPRPPRTRLQTFWDGAGRRTRSNLTVIVTVMVAVVMILQGVTFAWAIHVTKRATEIRRAETNAFLDHLTDIAERNHRDMQVHRCRQEDVHESITRKVGATPPPDPAPPECPPEFTHENRPPG